MLSSLRKVLIGSLTAALVGGFISGAKAEYVYDFDTNVGAALTTGALYDQDGWLKAGTGTGTLQIADDAANWNGKFVTQKATGAADTQDYRINNGNWSYSIDPSQSFEISCLVRVGGNGTSNYGALGGVIHYYSGAAAGNNSALVGTWNSSLWWHIGGTAYTKAATDLFTKSDDKVFEVGITVTPGSIAGEYSVQRFYQDITGSGTRQNEGDLILISDSGVVGEVAHWNVSDWDCIAVRVNTVVGSRIDEITIRAVPEPSTFAILGIGLIGLLAYAWRKRK